MHMQDHENQNARTLPKYMDVLKLKSKSTQKLFSSTMNNICMFGRIDMTKILEYDEEEIHDRLQDWIMWNAKRGITTASIMCYFNSFRSYLRYRRIRIDWNYMLHDLTFPQMLHENKTPVTPDVIRKILSVSEPEFRFQLLALVSSGMRSGELGQIRPKHLDFTCSNIAVRIPAQITKTGRSRVTFFSRQVSDMIRYRMKNKPEFTFCGTRTPEQSLNLIIKRFSVARKKTGMIERYDHCKQNRYKVHVHGLRSYFITKTNKIQFGLGHILAGHDFYMKQYNQYTVDEMLSMYRDAEDDLTFRGI